MDYSPDFLTCVPRALLLVASLRGISADAETIWRTFRPRFVMWNSSPYGSAVSYALDIARHYSWARHLDVTHHAKRAKAALDDQAEVFGVLLFAEDAGAPGIETAHCMAVQRIEEVPSCPDHVIHVLHPQTIGPAVPASFPSAVVRKVNGFFGMLYVR
jgi:hypothetical protein